MPRCLIINWVQDDDVNIGDDFNFCTNRVDTEKRSVSASSLNKYDA